MTTRRFTGPKAMFAAARIISQAAAFRTPAQAAAQCALGLHPPLGLRAIELDSTRCPISLLIRALDLRLRDGHG